MCKEENRLLDFKHSIFSSPTAPRTKGKRRNNKLPATEISLCYRLSNNKVPQQIQKMSSCSYRSFWSIHHSWTKTYIKRFHGSLNRRKGRPTGPVQVRPSCFCAWLCGMSENQRGQPLPNAKGEQSKFIENSMFHDTNIIICQSQVMI